MLLQYCLKSQWSSAIKQLVAIGEDVTNAVNKAKMLKHTTESTMAAFNLRQSCTFRLRQLEEIENNGKTHITTKTDETGAKM